MVESGRFVRPHAAKQQLADTRMPWARARLLPSANPLMLESGRLAPACSQAPSDSDPNPVRPRPLTAARDIEQLPLDQIMQHPPRMAVADAQVTFELHG